MKRILFIVTLVSIVVFAACSKKSSSSKTPKVVLTTYDADIVPLLQARCTPCHLPSKGGSKANFENYAGASKFGAEMLARVQRNPGERGFMPFKQAKLSEEEIAIFKKWVNGGMLEK